MAREEALRKARYEESCKRYQAEIDRVMNPQFIDTWLNDPRPLCPVCKLPSDSVSVYIDPFLLEIYDRKEEWVSCASCYRERADEV